MLTTMGAGAAAMTALDGSSAAGRVFTTIFSGGAWHAASRLAPMAATKNTRYAVRRLEYDNVDMWWLVPPIGSATMRDFRRSVNNEAS